MAFSLPSRKRLDELFPRESDFEIKHRYEKIKNELVTGDMIFFSGNHWISKLIRWRSGGAWSHVGIVIKIEEINRIFLVESIREVGVRMIPMSFVIKDYYGHELPYGGRVAWARYSDLTIEEASHIKNFCMDNLSKQYDRREYWRILMRTISGKHKVYRDDKYTCAEFIYEAFKRAEIRLRYDRGNFISPSAIWRNEEIEMKGMII